MNEKGKLIYISNSVFPSVYANSVHVMKMCNAFSLSGYDVTLLAKKTQRVNADIFKMYGVTEGFDLRAFSIFGSRVLSLFYSFFIFVAFSLLNVKGGVVYSRNRHSSFVLSFFKINHTYEMHGIASNIFQCWLDGVICRSCNLTKIVVISNVLKQDVVKLYKIHESKVLVAHDGADLHSISEVLDTQLNDEGKPSVGYVGSLLPGKGVELLCQASFSLTDVSFHIVGGKEEDIDRLKLKFPRMDNVYFYGYVDHSEVPRFIKKFDYVVLPNEEKVITKNGEDIGKYTSPLKLFEYLSFNKIIISSDLEVLKEVIGDDYAYLFKAGDVFSFIEVVNECLLSQGKEIKNGRDLVKEKYSWTNRAKKVVEK